jgi:hypothetical protein
MYAEMPLLSVKGEHVSFFVESVSACHLDSWQISLIFGVAGSAYLIPCCLSLLLANRIKMKSRWTLHHQSDLRSVQSGWYI